MNEPERNKLAGESSPYLQEHADNPVDWYPWGDQALKKAREEDKPIFLSIGYSACHWCHVMKRESFQDAETARLMNEYFINVKVDREERPDLDEIYMQAVQAMTGRGGWPMSVFLTPELEPFYGGTYFPPEARQGMPSFRDVLERVHRTFVEKRDEVEENAGQLLNELKRLESLEGSDEVPGTEYLKRVYDQLVEQFDPEWGGFGSAPKFPRVMDLQLLTRLSRDESSYPEANAMLSRTLDAMMRGGIYDQVGGGFARYSTDRKWLVPHFEKMLYDNAQLVDCYATAYRLLGDPSYRRVVEQTLRYLQREMSHPEGGFYSTQDAESEGVEGKYYVWDYEPFVEAVGDRADLLTDYYNVTPEGNFEGKNILHVTEPPSEFCDKHGCEPEELETILEEARNRLLEVRERREKPHRDEKILTDWNGLMAAACGRAGFLLDEPEYTRMSRNALEFLLEHAEEDGALFHVTKDGQSHTPGFLDDYAFAVKALLQQFQCSGELKWLRRARQFFERAVESFWDGEQGGFYMTGPRHGDPIVRSKSVQDKAQPSGNSEMVLNALKLAELTGENRFRNYARDTLMIFDRHLQRAPTSVTRMLCGLYDYHGEAREIVLVGDSTQRRSYLDVLRRLNPDNTVLFQTDLEDDRVHRETNLLEGRDDGPIPAAYLCRGGSCRRPATSPDDFEKQLQDIVPE